MVPKEKTFFYQKAARYCGYQERTEKEVQEKLSEWGVESKEEAAYIIQTLKENRFLDEERYVEAFIRGKFLNKKWGKRKLWAALHKKAVNPILIQKGLTTLEKEDYLQSLRYVAERKEQSLSGLTSAKKKQKLTSYLLQKGYEPDLVNQIVQEILVP